MENNELTHWGIPGMKWGKRRFQNKDGSLTPAGRERYADDDTDNDPNVKEHALKSGSASDVLKYKGRLSNQELQAAVQRINLERQLSELSAKETVSKFDKIDSVMNKVGKVTDWANKGINAYNVVAKVNNSLNGKMQLPTIDGNKKAVVDAAKEKLLNTGTAKQIKDNFDKLTAEEKSRALKRLQTEEAITKKIAQYESPSVDIKMDKKSYESPSVSISDPKKSYSSPKVDVNDADDSWVKSETPKKSYTPPKADVEDWNSQKGRSVSLDYNPTDSLSSYKPGSDYASASAAKRKKTIEKAIAKASDKWHESISVKSENPNTANTSAADRDKEKLKKLKALLEPYTVY